jgi:hypothetical protein
VSVFTTWVPKTRVGAPAAAGLWDVYVLCSGCEMLGEAKYWKIGKIIYNSIYAQF